ncbi:MAG: BspA family leucine-rich repeat surface protein, partial [Alphaproteobacteria bacterium]|nr:BspA family leucine-rich repeat surface protein [Alphaproteobacteria bacterium]
MKFKFLFTSLLLLLMSFATFAQNAKEPYVILKDGTATFYYKDSKPEEALPLQSFYDTDWTDDVRKSVKKVVFNESFNDYKPTSCEYWLYGLHNLTKIIGMKDYLNTDNVTNMSSMFSGCSSLTTIDVSKFSTNNVEEMSSMFNGCSGLTQLDVSHFNTENVITMRYMFEGCSSLTNIDLSNFNTMNVTDMRYMFRGCSGLSSLDLSNFNTTNVIDMMAMFWDCSGLISLNISNFNTEKVTNMGYLFTGCNNLTTLDVSGFKTDNVQFMNMMFANCSKLTTLNVSNFNTKNVTEMEYMFDDCSGLTTIDVTKFNTGKVTYMYNMFQGCSSLVSLDLTGFNTNKVEHLSDMFAGCSGLESIYVNDGWSLPSLGGSFKGNVFKGCDKLRGGEGTVYDESHTDASYAHIDGGSENPGYFTYKPPVPIYISFKTLPNKTVYHNGEELDLTGGVLEITYNNNTTEEVALSEANISGFDKTKKGEQTVIVEYQGCETFFTTPVSDVVKPQSNAKVWASNSTI